MKQPNKHARNTRHTRETLSTKKQGDITFTQIVYAVIGLLVLTVLAILLMKSAGNPLQLFTSTEYSGRARLCEGQSNDNTRQQGITPSCDPSPQDKDGDCLLDTCDPCIDTTKPQAKSGISGKAERQAMGSQGFDKDHDGVPDACDSKPVLASRPICTWDSEREHCLTSIKRVNLNNKPVELASLGTEEKVSRNYQFG